MEKRKRRKEEWSESLEQIFPASINVTDNAGKIKARGAWSVPCKVAYAPEDLQKHWATSSCKMKNANWDEKRVAIYSVVEIGLVRGLLRGDSPNGAGQCAPRCLEQPDSIHACGRLGNVRGGGTFQRTGVGTMASFFEV